MRVWKNAVVETSFLLCSFIDILEKRGFHTIVTPCKYQFHRVKKTDLPKNAFSQSSKQDYSSLFQEKLFFPIRRVYSLSDWCLHYSRPISPQWHACSRVCISLGFRPAWNQISPFPTEVFCLLGLMSCMCAVCVYLRCHVFHCFKIAFQNQNPGGFSPMEIQYNLGGHSFLMCPAC